jgi:hypothetical protein
MARAAAENAGVDHTTAYVRRRTHGAFAEAWVEALAKHEAAKKRDEEERANGRAPALSLPPLRDGFPSSVDGGGAEYVFSGKQVKRASGERWGKKKQDAYLAELAASANHRRASKAAGISYDAVLRRRHNDPHLEAMCKAAIAACQARAPEFLASAMAATFDPEAVLDAEVGGLPRVSIDQAIKIAQLKGSPGSDASALENKRADIEEVRARLEKAMRALNLISDEELEKTCPHCGRTFASGG